MNSGILAINLEDFSVEVMNSFTDGPSGRNRATVILYF